ncbi:MAG: hypothetical protein EOO50_02235 [Flavobacterium sp.]|uniref:hypothetical protein n=1 Tax=Flavobacterium sp. TaxID=239 RepID=UPI0012236365|nr:hypothetical protein [Flavobacterium sp.]RZJ68259.1 MAG: hypothetical protein EOO50_02235 [Flavobacterium sp.]
MKTIMFLIFAMLTFGISSAQAKARKTTPVQIMKKAPNEITKKKTKKIKKEANTAGKNDPNEKGSGMTTTDQDKPKLDDPIPDAVPGTPPNQRSN